VPEGDTVFRAARRLDAALAGSTLVHGEIDVPAYSTADLAGFTVDQVVARGKHLLMRLRRGDERLTLHSHLKMDGAWVLVPASRPPRAGPAHEVRARLSTEQWHAIGTLLGTVTLLPTDDEHQVVGHLGPDPLDDAFDAAEAVRRLAGQPDREVAEALRDQRNLAGLGNELVVETLYLRGVHPWRPVREVELDPLVALATKVIRANATRRVRSFTGDLRPGRTTYVYGREGRPCRRCGARVSARDQGAPTKLRRTWWCPVCQPER
jgi:endonuclease-8